MLRDLVLRGGEGRVSWGYTTPAEFTAWAIARRYQDPAAGWTLTATIKRIDSVRVRMALADQKMRPQFNAPRRGGWWSWPIVAASVAPDGRRFTARLGRPEQ